MNKTSAIKKYTLLAGVLFLFPLSLVLFFGVYTEHNFNTLPYLGPYELDARGDTLRYRLPNFAFINQNAEVVTLDSLQGKVWLAAFYGTNSPHIRKITARLLWPNFRYRSKDDIAIVSFSLDPDHDTPEVLKAYIEQTTRYNDHDGKWQFLTGDRETINAFIRNGFMLDDIEHTAMMFLVDSEGHLRGQYNGNLEDEIKDAIEDIALLKKEIDLRAYEEKKRIEAAGRGK
jgi:protein SCO1/2